MGRTSTTGYSDVPHERNRSRQRRLLFVVNVDWFFLSHRLPLARAAKAAGFDVWVAAADTGSSDMIRNEGLQFEPLPITRARLALSTESRTFRSLLTLYRRVRPDVIHHVTVKPVIYGSLAARLAGNPLVINAIPGFGYTLTGSHNRLQALVTISYRIALRSRRSRTIFQNPDDLAYFVEHSLIRPEQAVLIRGAGVDCVRFSVRPVPVGKPIVLLAGRMLRIKGVDEFVAAAQLLQAERVEARFVLVGGTDANPTAISAAQLSEWDATGVVEWWGYRDDMPEVLSQAAIVTLPSRGGEGLPKSLLEAAACGRALVATNIPGCREIVRPGQNGILVPPRDPEALAHAIKSLVENEAMRDSFGRASRRIVEEEFAVEHVVQQTLALYGSALAEAN